MESQRFDQITRGLATRGNRRSLLRGLTGITAASMAALGLGHQARFARALQNATSTEEQSVLLFEEMGQIAHNHSGACEELTAKITQFGADHAELLAAHKAEQQAWDGDRRAQHANTYGDRRDVASAYLLATLTWCKFAVATSAISIPPGGATPATPAIRGWQQPMATPVTSPGTEQPGAQSPTCNGQLKVACESTTGKVTPYSTVPATCDDYLCHEPCVDDNYCATTWPEFCETDLSCSVIVDVRTDACPDSDKFVCANPNNGATSPYFLASATNCSDPAGDDCKACVSEEYCSVAYPDICPPGVCALTNSVVPPDCCHKACPLSTSDCALSVLSGPIAGNTCMTCQLMWCGSTSSCLSHCKSSLCCDADCNTTNLPIPPDDGDD